MAYTFNYNGTDYFLEFDKESILLAEEALDLSFSDLRSYKITTMQKMFWAALLKHHPNIKANTVEMLYSKQKDKRGLHNDLLEMYAEHMNALLEDGDDEGEALTRKKV